MDSKSAKEAALQKLLDMLDAGESEGLKGLKKPSVTAIEIDAKKPAMDDEDSSAPSDFAKAWEEMKGAKKPDEDSMDEESHEPSDEELSEDDIKRMEDLIAAHRSRK